MPDRSSKARRVAAVDIGTNTTLLLIAEATPTGPVAVLQRAEITRLGQGVAATGMLDPKAIERTLDVLDTYAKLAREFGVERIVAVGTSASRDARNSESFRARAEKILGGPVEIISGQREATLTFQGALGGLGLAEGAPATVIDVGGGSTEIVLGTFHQNILADDKADNMKRWAHSYNAGSVRMTESYADQANLQKAITSIFAHPPVPNAPEDSTVVAIAGTATTFAAIDLKIVDYPSSPPHGHSMTRARLQEIILELSHLDLASRGQVIGLDPKRADVIVAGGWVLDGALAAVGADRFVVSDRGVRWGLCALHLYET